MVSDRIRVSPKFSEIYKKLGEEKIIDLANSGESLAQKHMAVDRRLMEIGKREVEFSNERSEFELRKRDIINQLNEKEVFKHLKIEYEKVKLERDRLKDALRDDLLK